MATKAHPKCPGCSKALYKALEKGGKSKSTDPYAFCRNPSCEPLPPQTQAWLNRKNAKSPPATPVLSTFDADLEGERTTVVKRRQRRRRATPAKKPTPVDPLQMTRETITKFLDPFVKERTEVEIGILLAIVSQETGHPAAANAVIDQHGLERYGVKKQT